MDEIIAGVAEILKGYGLQGVVMGGLAFVAWRLWKVIEAKDARIEVLQDKHVERTETTTRALLASTEGAEDQTKAMIALTEVVKEVLRERRAA